MTAPRTSVGVGELQRAWRAIQAGSFHTSRDLVPVAPRTSRPALGALTEPPGTLRWRPAVGEWVVPVIGCHGCAGASTFALALATTAVSPARVVECVGATASGLAGASTAELGVDASGWAQGRRGSVLIERAATPRAAVTAVPVPSAAPWPDGVTVLDVGWELGQVLGADSWVTDQVLTAPSVVLVARASVPGLRRLEGALALLSESPPPTGRDREVTVAVLGPRRSRWPAFMRHSIGAGARDVAHAGRWVDVVEDRTLARRGLDSMHYPAFYEGVRYPLRDLPTVSSSTAAGRSTRSSGRTARQSSSGSPLASRSS